MIKKAGDQPGHEGKTLECSAVIDTIVEHVPAFCNCCGKDLGDVPETLVESRQFIDIPVIKPVCIEHRVYCKTCSCGYNTESNFPSNLTAKVQYGPNVESLTGYLHARQYLPYQRMKEFFTDVMGLPVSVGGINNILKRLTQKALPYYEQIKERISKSIFVGTDETGVKVNSQKDWTCLPAGRYGHGKMMILPLLHTPIAALKPLKIILLMDYPIQSYFTTGLPVISTVRQCTTKSACHTHFVIYNNS